MTGLIVKEKDTNVAYSVCYSLWVSTLIWPSFIKSVRWHVSHMPGPLMDSASSE